MPKLSQILFGRKEKNYQQSLLTPEQQQLQDYLEQASKGYGAPGAFGEAADYYRDILQNDSSQDPEMRRFQEEIIPGLSEQFSGLGGFRGNSFRNGAANASQSLSERLGALRAGLRQNAAQGLSSIGQFALQPRVENIHRPETTGLVGSFAKGAGEALGSGLGHSMQQPFMRSGGIGGNYGGTAPSINPQQVMR